MSQLARGCTAPSGAGGVDAGVLASVSWDQDSSEPRYQQGIRSDAREVVVPELVFEPQT